MPISTLCRLSLLLQKGIQQNRRGKIAHMVHCSSSNTAETDFQWLLINLKTQIPHQLPVWRVPTFLYASVTCHLKSWRRQNRFQNQMVCIHQCLQANKPNIRRFAQVVVSPYKVHAAQLIL